MSTPLPIFSGNLKRTSNKQESLLAVIYIATFTARALRNNGDPRRDCTNQIEIHHYTSSSHMQHVAIPRRDAECLRHSYTEGLPNSPVFHTTTARDFLHARRYRTHTSLTRQTLNYNNYDINEQHTTMLWEATTPGRRQYKTRLRLHPCKVLVYLKHHF